MKIERLFLMLLTISTCCISSCSTKSETSKFNNAALYYHAKFLLGDTSSLQRLKENSPGLFHHANISNPVTGGSSIEWLKKNNQALFHYSNFLSADKLSKMWLMKNNQDLYHIGNFIYYADRSSLEWLKVNNQGLYRYVQALLGDKSSLDWLLAH